MSFENCSRIGKADFDDRGFFLKRNILLASSSILVWIR